jgi:hypothetical protein
MLWDQHFPKGTVAKRELIDPIIARVTEQDWIILGSLVETVRLPAQKIGMSDG